MNNFSMRNLNISKHAYLKGVLLHFLVFVLLVFFIVSCSVERKVIKAPLKEYGVDTIFKRLKKNEFKFESLSANFNAEIEINQKKNSFKGILRIRKDSAIWISVTPVLGIEVARLLVTNDSVKMMNRLNSTYFTGNFKLINKLFNADIDYDMFQSFLVGNDFTYYENGVSGKFKANIENKQYHLSTAERRKLKKYSKSKEDIDRLFIQNLLLDPETFKINALTIKEKKFKDENRKLEVRYNDFRLVENQLFPYHLEVEISDKEQKVILKIDFSKLVLNTHQNFPFTISSKYQKIEK